MKIHFIKAYSIFKYMYYISWKNIFIKKCINWKVEIYESLKSEILILSISEL